MEIHKITDDLQVAGQIGPSDIPELASKGIKTIICNRPDSEAPGQPSFSEIERLAEAEGIKAIYHPIRAPNAISDADAEIFEKEMADAEKPVLAFCRTGTRSAFLWSLSQAGKLPAQEIALKAMRAGYDISPVLQRLEK
ncbi:TIGR01244 family phosphatase [Rhodomicrobium sp. Az07]|uniref:TIGR01244 family sulfur transferase n=1 Tax=Rhodomicrobium sp. Az07 TaxID=2839034 RepID=UPI001BE71F2C|nr:TIGR01244 family sulfur transferase [Rhodomicrobium sp. Az07]MBT3070137.1 TIGR01244 family phosphatase [Rhodomicrobium sp. Az07]